MMGTKIDLTRKRFGRLVVMQEGGRDKQGRIVWKCECDCGHTTTVRGDHLRSKRIKSCGCLLKERITKHGLLMHPLYKIWIDMRSRCRSSNNTAYEYYGGRGITVCDEWEDSPEPFIKWAEENGWKKGLEIDRKDNDKGYSPENCRFTNRSGNNLNTRLLCSKNTSGFRGVSLQAIRKKYRASIKVNGKVHNLGSFKTAVEAAKARDKFVIKKGIHTPLNFNNERIKKQCIEAKRNGTN